MVNDKKVWDWRGYILEYAPEKAPLRQLLLTLSCYMNSAGESCFPSIDTLEKVTCLTRPTVIKYLKMAEDEGWIEISKHGYGGQKWKRNEYRAMIPDKVVKEIYHVLKGGKPSLEGGKTDNEKVVKEVNSNSPLNSSANTPKSCFGVDDFFELYGDSRGEERVRGYWEKLEEGERKMIRDFIPAYLNFESREQFRKTPINFLLSKIWKDDPAKWRKNGSNGVQNASTNMKIAQRGVKYGLEQVRYMVELRGECFWEDFEKGEDGFWRLR